MTAANVTFETLDYQDAEGGKEERFSFDCPKHKGRSCEGLLIRGKGNDVPEKTWEWSGGRESPTFVPSINCQGCWHGYIRDGRCVDTGGKDEPEL
jgi:hypothetical protein